MKKIYIEITNNCNLNCDFCIHNERKAKFMSMEEFKLILSKIKNHTKYIYLHVLGEPLLHPEINEFINEASKDFYVNITTNGYLIKVIENNKNIRQLNISLHSATINKESYLENIFNVVNKLKKYTFINYRLWTNKDKVILDTLKRKYHFQNPFSNRLDENIFIDLSSKFTWPDLENNISKKKGKCYAIKDHIAILVDGTVVPCCLDAKGVINLGNIFESNLNDILNSSKVLSMKKGFEENKLTEELCTHCGFIDKINGGNNE